MSPARRPERRKPQKLSDDLRIRLSDGLLVAVVTASAYIFAFSYETGFARVFRIPSYLVSVTPTSMLSFASALLASIALAVVFMSVLMAVFPTNLSSTRNVTRVVVILVIAVILGFLLLFGLYNWLSSLIVIVLLVFLTALFMALGMFITRFFNSWSERAVTRFPQVFYAIYRYSGPVPMLLFIYLLVGTYIAGVIGGAEAIRQTDFLVTTIGNKSEMAVLRVYGDTLICAEFDKDTGVVKPNLAIIKLSSEKPFQASLESVGPLRVPSGLFPSTATPTMILSPIANASPSLPITISPVSTQATPP